MATEHGVTGATGATTAMTGQSTFVTGQHEADDSLASKILKPLAIVLALAIGGYVAYEVIINNKSPSDIVSFLHSKGQEVIGLFWDTGGDSTVTTPPAGGQEVVAAPPAPAAEPPIPAEPPAPEPPAPAAEVPPLAEGDSQDMPLGVEDIPAIVDAEEGVATDQDVPSSIADNPYLELPNRFTDNRRPPGRIWSPQEEEVWRSGIVHQFAWQQYKTVQDVITLRLAGSEAILWEALNNPRLWTRMKAVVGLVRFGANVDSQTVLRALGEERPSLVANYFKRFTVRSDSSQRFVMRYAVRTVGPRARLQIIRTLAAGREEVNKLYLVAATIDHDPRVSRWAEAELQRQQLPPQDIERYRKQVTSSAF